MDRRARVGPDLVGRVRLARELEVVVAQEAGERDLRFQGGVFSRRRRGDPTGASQGSVRGAAAQRRRRSERGRDAPDAATATLGAAAPRRADAAASTLGAPRRDNPDATATLGAAVPRTPRRRRSGPRRRDDPDEFARAARVPSPPSWRTGRRRTCARRRRTGGRRNPRTPRSGRASRRPTLPGRSRSSPARLGFCTPSSTASGRTCRDPASTGATGGSSRARGRRPTRAASSLRLVSRGSFPPDPPSRAASRPARRTS